MNIGDKIRIARQKKGLTQEELGDILGVQRSAVAKYENGRVVNIKRSMLKKISDVLDIKPSELIFEPTEETQQKNDTIADVVLRLRTDDEFFNVVDRLATDDVAFAFVDAALSLDDVKLNSLIVMTDALKK